MIIVVVNIEKWMEPTISLCTSVALGRENLSVCLQDGQFVYKTGRGPTITIWRFPEGVLKEEIQL